MFDGGEGCHKQEHDIDAGLVLQAEAGLRNAGPCVEGKGESPTFCL
jgi:hypothetical protein